MNWQLLCVAVRDWSDLDGYAIANGTLDLEELPVHKLCHYVWYWMIRKATDPKDIDRLKSRLWQPPEGEEGQGVWSAESEADSFSALKKALG